ncbi:MAG: ribonuclease HII [Meiothermus sp.]|uniref:ribonuclease HII n=1 Tax=Meiothermus sp. TaxID=1955249 RepID=UPI0025EBE5BA|nr:ribonuclease HII [Meiothermus sp.]MCS7059365.1 ribonuclease HII [Meiothermus sp.]MCS7194601.1 ribonuclease HII [Meiothermus sp.]MCX7740790.1 ribonuclease HII [Meiothermus sp.]MDW8091976.1 ribonuclease HII [Meiothermus sp.]MDW8481891.1 ribonuclease HII [Meiothermus sp.]
MEPPLEAEWWAMGLRVAGVDEAGRGAWAGPVVAAAVILPGPGPYPFADSKALSPAQREALEVLARRTALAFGIGWAEAAEVDQLGILEATHRAALRALAQLHPKPHALLTDYLHLKAWRDYAEAPSYFRSPPKADQRSPSVAAASILAKVARDRYMQALELRYPGYGFDRNKGYGTPEHRAALRRLGPCPEHRRSFAPLRRA